MASNDAWKVLLQVELDKNSKKTIVDQLLDLQKGLASVDIKVDIDDKKLKEFKSKLEGVGKSTKIFDATDGSKKLVKEIEKVEDSMGNVVKVTTEYDKKTEKVTKHLEEMSTDYDKQNKYLQKSLDIYDEIDKSIGKIFAVDDKLGGFVDKKELERLMDSFGAISIDADNMTTDLAKVNKLVSTLNKELDSVEKQAKSTAESIRLAQVKQGYDKQVKSDNINSDGIYTYTASAIDQQIQAREQQAKMFSKAIKEQMELEYKRASLMAKDAENEIKAQERLEKQIREVNLAKKSAMASINNIKTSQDNYNVSEAKRLVNELEKIPPEAEDAKLRIRELNAEIKDFGVNSKAASTTSNSFNDSLKRWASFVGLYEMFQLTKRAVDDMVSSVVSLDTELTNLQKVSDLASSNIGSFTKEMFVAAGELGRTGTELVAAVGNFAQAGYSASDGTAQILGEQSILMQNIGDGITSVDMATEILISTLKSYNMTAEESVNINNLLNQVSNTSAVSFSKLADMIGRSSALMAQSGTSIEELAGMATAAYEIIQSSERVSTSLNTVSLRIRALKTGVSEVDGEPIAKMGEILDKFGVKIIDASGELRDFYDIMEDLAVAYKDMSNADKQLVTQSVGGARNSAVLSALLTNWESSQSAINEALNSTGSALKENAIFTESLQGHINSLNSSWQQFANTSIDSEFVKSILDLATGTLKFLDACDGIIPLLTTILGLIVAIKAQKIGTFAIDGIKILMPAMQKLSAVLGLVSSGWMSMSGAMSAVGISASTLVTGGIGVLVVALGALTMAINANKKAQEERLRQAKQNVDSYHDEISKTNELIESYKKLSSSDLNVKENREQLISIQKQLAEQYGIEVRNIDLLNKSMEENISILDEAIEKKKRYFEIDSNLVQEDLNEKLNNQMFLPNVSGTSEEFKNGIKEILKQMEDQFAVYGKNGQFTIKLNPELDEEQALSALDELISKLELSGQKGTMFYETVANAYLDLSDAINNVNSEQQKMIDSNARNVVKSFTSDIEDVTKATQQQYDVIKQDIYGKYASNISEATKNEKELKAALLELDNVFSHLTPTVSDTNDEVEDFEKIIEGIDSKLDGLSDNVDTLNSAISKLEDGTGLTGDEIRNLIEKFPSLRDALVKSEEGFSINESALKSLREETIEYERQSIQSQINAAKQAIVSSMTRIGAYKTEILAISSLAEATNMLSNLGKGAKGNQIFGSYRPATYVDELSNDEQKLYDSVKNIEDLYKQLENIDIIEAGGIGDRKKSSSSKSKSEKLTDPFKLALEEIKRSRQEIENEIAILSEKISMADLQGDTSLSETLNKELEVLYAKLPQVNNEIAEQYRLLKQKFTTQEQIAELDDLIQGEQMAWWQNTNQLIEHQVYLLERKKEILEAPLENMGLMQSQLESQLKLAELQNVATSERIDLQKQLIFEYDVESNYLKLTIDDLYKQRELASEIPVKYKMLTEMIVGFENQYADAIEKQVNAKQQVVDLLYKELEAELERSIYGSGGKAEWEKSHDKKIDALNDELDALKKQTDEKNKQAQAEKYQLEMAELKEKLANAKKQKTTQEFKQQVDGSWQWEYTYDADLVAGIEKEISDKELAEQKRREEEKQREREESLRKEIETLQREKQAKEAFFNTSKEDLLNYLQENKDTLIVNGEEVLEIIGTNMDTISEEFDVRMSAIVSNVESSLSRIRSALEEALSIQEEMDDLGSGGEETSNDSDGKVDSKDSVNNSYVAGGNGFIEKPKKRFATGGIADYTGLAFVDGTKDRPERVLSAEQTASFEKLVDILPRFDFKGVRAMSHMDVGIESVKHTASSSNAKQEIKIGNISLPNVSNANDFVAEMSKLANSVLNKSKLMPSGE